MIAFSDNSATNALIDLIGISEVNNTLKSLGMSKTLLQRKMMNSEASARGESCNSRRSYQDPTVFIQRRIR